MTRLAQACSIRWVMSIGFSIALTLNPQTELLTYIWLNLRNSPSTTWGQKGKIAALNISLL